MLLLFCAALVLTLDSVHWLYIRNARLGLEFGENFSIPPLLASEGQGYLAVCSDQLDPTRWLVAALKICQMDTRPDSDI